MLWNVLNRGGLPLHLSLRSLVIAANLVSLLYIFHFSNLLFTPEAAQRKSDGIPNAGGSNVVFHGRWPGETVSVGSKKVEGLRKRASK